MFSHNDLLRINESVEEWYEENGRAFPWRKKTISPFEVLIAETLLWKTRAETIRGFFHNFVERYNNPEKLAKTRWQKLAKEIEPLGLHERRAKSLVKLGKALSGKSIPKTQKELERLPGVGQYIARAVLCFGYGLSFIPVDVRAAGHQASF
jgi:A/G-specific adenine glycosylase